MNRYQGNYPQEGHDGVQNQSRFYCARAVGHDTHALTRAAQALRSSQSFTGSPDPANIKQGLYDTRRCGQNPRAENCGHIFRRTPIKQRHPMFTGVALLEVLRIWFHLSALLIHSRMHKSCGTVLNSAISLKTAQPCAT